MRWIQSRSALWLLSTVRVRQQGHLDRQCRDKGKRKKRRDEPRSQSSKHCQWITLHPLLAEREGPSEVMWWYERRTERHTCLGSGEGGLALADWSADKLADWSAAKLGALRKGILSCWLNKRWWSYLWLRFWYYLWSGKELGMKSFESAGVVLPPA